MDEYINKHDAVDAGYLSDWYIASVGDESPVWTDEHIDELLNDFIVIPKDTPVANVQEKRYCKMIPLDPDCREYTDIFICTNCHQHIHLGFYRKEYSGSYCLECGAEVKDGDTECQ